LTVETLLEGGVGGEKKKPKQRSDGFPRFFSWERVRRLREDVLSNRVGKKAQVGLWRSQSEGNANRPKVALWRGNVS